MEDKTVATIVLIGIAAVGISTTTYLALRVRNLKLELRSKEIEINAWKRSYRSVFDKLTPTEMLHQLEDSLNQLKFLNIVKDI